MQMTEIRKQSLGVIDQVNDQIVTLAQQASQVLGYDVLRKTTGAVAVELTPLQTALKELEIETLFPGDVLKYQKERQIEQTMSNLQKWLKEFEQSELVARYHRFDGPAWDKQLIGEYKQPIPEFVLAKAIQIKQLVPECQIWVESLHDHPDPFLVVSIPDPRGAYYTPLENYYIEVWAEPKFEGRL